MVANAAVPPTGVACRHCGAAMESAEARYCCSGCEMAAAIIDGAGLERYYAEREALPPRPGLMVQGFSRIATTPGPDGNVSIRLQIDGLRCASCVWVTERVLEQTPGVLDVSISYASGRANLRWNPQQTDLDQIAARISHLGYRPRPIDAAPTWDRALLLRLGVATFSAMNMMMLAISVYLGWWEGMDPHFAALFRWAALALATPVALWSAVPFYQGAWRGLQHRMLHMDLPVSLGIFVLYGHGVIATLLDQDAYLDSLGMLVMLLLIGRVLEQRGRQNAAAAAASLAAVVPQQVRRLQGSQIETISPEQLQIGDVILVGAGEEIGADGRIISGTGNVRMALLTGESAPVAVKAGDRVVAGAALMEGSVQVAVEAVGAESLVGQMARGLQEAGDRPMEPALPDRIAPYFTGLTLLASVATFTGWYLHSGISDALTSTVAVLVVACPCALALSAPLSAAAGLGAAARRGLLLRSGDALRRLASVQDIALDKTGTLTGGELEVEEASPEGLRIAAALERESIHPIARAIVAEAIQRGIPLAQAEGVLETAGVGISGRVDGQLWSLGRGDAAGEVVLTGPSTFVLRLRDRIRPDAAQTIAALKHAGLRVVMLSGDHAEVAAHVGASVGVDQAVGELSPAEKVLWIEQHPRPTLFVGDGLNDGPALRAAHVGIAMAGGAASSVLVADGIVAAAAVGPLLAGIRAARLSTQAVQNNLRRSLIYNFLAIAAAAAGLVNPLVAALLMPLSSGMVIWGASRIEHQMQRFVKDDA